MDVNLNASGEGTDAVTPQGPAQVIQVLVVEAQESMRRFLTERLQSDPQLRVVQAVGDARSALDFLARHRPHVVLMDHRMPGFDGFETTRRIMETKPLPIVMCTSTGAGDAVFRALEAGAVACVEKPLMDGPSDAAVAHLLQTLRLMSEVRVVRRWVPGAMLASRSPHTAPAPATGGSIGAVGIGASTGGPPVLQTILAALPADFALPVLIVQHIAKGFLPGMAEWLRQTSGLKVQIAAYGVQVMPGHVYMAPDDFQMGLSSDGHIVLTRSNSGEGLCPSVACLFDSLADVCGRQAIGVLLTGMGKDGAAELKRLKDCGAVTLVQDKASSVVHGMPGEAVRLDAATQVLPPERIAQQLIQLARQHAARKRS